LVLLLAASVSWAEGTDTTGAPTPPAEVTTPVEPSFSDIPTDPRKPEITLVAGRRILQGYPDGTFRPAGTVSERDFAGILDRLIVACPAMAKPSFEMKDPEQAISRLRAVIVIVRAAAEKDALDSVTDPKAVFSKCSDYDKIPDWGRKQAAFAVGKGYMRIESQFRPDDPITRSELAEILARCLPPNALHPNQPEAKYTGLGVDCTEIGLARSMSPWLVSEDGTRIYPDPKHLPSIEFIEDQGLVSYVTDIANSKRAGNKPLEVKAVKACGAANQTAVVSDADRDAILAAEQDSHFFANWNVTFLMPPK
jgi:hypothetical protein